MEDEVSYRQVGREKGLLHPPRLRDDGRQRQTENERDAFGNRTQRFSKRKNDVPPPGAYYRRSTFERDGRVCGSVSSKGFGSGFVSATPRFRDVKMLQQAYLPGPGSYLGEEETRQDGAKLTSFSSLKRECGFTPDSLAAVPGPGQYNVDRRTAPRAGSGPTSSFRCTRTPLDVGSHLQSPAPGTYELQQTPQTRVDKNGQVLKDSVFRSRTKRTFLATNDVPGPGEYDVEHGVAVEKDSMRGSGAVGAKDAGTGVGRSRSQPEPSSGRSKEDEEATPGPGWYTPHQTKPPVLSSSSSSMFRSGTKRFTKEAVAAAPGPAFYQPEPLGKKSFRWNAKKQWV